MLAFLQPCPARHSILVGRRHAHSGRRLLVAGIACGLFGLVAPGCSAKPKDLPDLGPVSGTITLDGQPLANVTVVFESETGRSSFGKTDDAGKYELIYTGNYKGAVVGKNKVVINSNLDAPPGPDWKDPIPAKYNAKSELTADVTAGSNTFDFALEGK